MGFFEKIKQGLSKTASSISSVFTTSMPTRTSSRMVPLKSHTAWVYFRQDCVSLTVLLCVVSPTGVHAVILICNHYNIKAARLSNLVTNTQNGACRFTAIDVLRLS